MTRLGLYGGPRGAYGSFAPKTEAGVTKEQVTRLGLYGGARALWGDFDPKAESGGAPVSKSQTTRLGLYGGARQVWGDFDPKTESGGVPVTKSQVSRLGLYGGPRFLWGTFDPKVETEVTTKGGKRRKTKIFVKEKGYFLEDDKYEADAALAYEVIGELEYNVVTEEYQDAEVTHEKPLYPTREDISIVLPESANIELLSLKGDLQAQIEAKKDQVYEILLQKYELELQKIEDELFFMLLALDEEDF